MLPSGASGLLSIISGFFHSEKKLQEFASLQAFIIQVCSSAG
jgi:hypothetical protein